MFIYRNGKFHFGSVSFALPEDVAVETSYCDVIIDGFRFYSFDGSIEMSIKCSSVGIKAQDKITNIFHDETGYTLIGEVMPIVYGGLKGYMAIFEDDDTINEEYAFDTPNGGEYDLLDVFVSIEKGSRTYDEAYKNRVVSEILNNIISI